MSGDVIKAAIAVSLSLLALISGCTSATSGGSPGTGGEGGNVDGATGAGGGNGSGGAMDGGGGAGARGGSGDAGANGGASGSPDARASADSAGGMGTPTIVAVGWNGLKLRSRDLGLTWTDRVKLTEEDREDDITLVRQIAYGSGVFVAAGHKIFTSPDGAVWTMRLNAQEDFVGGLTYGDGMFVAAGADGVNMRSPDGIKWKAGTKSIGKSHIRSAAFGNGQFAVGNDDKEVYLSSDGLTWTLSPALKTDHVSFCNGAFRPSRDCLPIGGFGVFLRTNGNAIERSLDGKVWKAVHVEPNGVASIWYTEFDTFGFGYSP